MYNLFFLSLIIYLVVMNIQYIITNVTLINEVIENCKLINNLKEHYKIINKNIANCIRVKSILTI